LFLPLPSLEPSAPGQAILLNSGDLKPDFAEIEILKFDFAEILRQMS
jgi:hypothetical protein